MGKAVIFDFDGVIINSTEVQRQAFFESYKLVVGSDSLPSFEEFLSHSGDSIQNILKKMNLPLEMVVPYRRISQEKIDNIKVYEGMKDLLAALKRENYKCGLCTGKDRERTLEILRRLKLYSYFDTIVCSDDVENPKPHPDSLIAAISNLEAAFDRSIMIGDSRNDILCAKKAGVRCIAVTWGDVRQDILEKEAPDFIANDTEELYKHIVS